MPSAQYVLPARNASRAPSAPCDRTAKYVCANPSTPSASGACQSRPDTGAIRSPRSIRFCHNCNAAALVGLACGCNRDHTSIAWTSLEPSARTDRPARPTRMRDRHRVARLRGARDARCKVVPRHAAPIHVAATARHDDVSVKRRPFDPAQHRDVQSGRDPSHPIDGYDRIVIGHGKHAYAEPRRLRRQFVRRHVSVARNRMRMQFRPNPVHHSASIRTVTVTRSVTTELIVAVTTHRPAVIGAGRNPLDAHCGVTVCS